jgi:predicted PurR-regulated permease PerM
MLPFVHILLWGMILGIAFMPMHNSLTKIFGGKPKLASTVIVLLSLVIIIIPSMLFLDSVIHSIKELKEAYFHKT